ncbi:MAG: tetratricopeptide repeat protein [Bacteroidetes bacterium]|nr:tetratricopeptide repeat protein [Bacteroidota bacterium]
MIKRFILFISAITILAGCAGQDADDLMKQASDLQKDEKPSEALVIYEQITREFAESPQAPEAMFRCALIYINEQGDPVKAATTYELVSEKYPDSEWGHKGLFAAGYTYANDIANLERARTAYEKYLTQYPDSSMTETVRFELENLGKSAEELLESIQESQSTLSEDGNGN